jgi:DnaJ-class molecular chaperone
MRKNCYQILQVAGDAEPEVIEYAYKARALGLEGKHDGVSAEELKRVRWAYKTLIDPAMRAKYDATLREQAALAEEAPEESGRMPARMIVGVVVSLAVILVASLLLL